MLWQKKLKTKVNACDDDTLHAFLWQSTTAVFCDSFKSCYSHVHNHILPNHCVSGPETHFHQIQSNLENFSIYTNDKYWFMKYNDRSILIKQYWSMNI